MLLRKKKAEGKLSSNLVHFTPANIRNEYRLLLSEGCDSTDQRMLREFFELPLNKELSDIPFRNCDPDKFKPLCNFLKKGINTREKNIELLAWLIDFQPRPYSRYWRLSSGKGDLLSELSVTEGGIVGNKEEPLYHHQNRLPFKKENLEDGFGRGIQCNTNGKELGGYSAPATEVLSIQKVVTLEYPSGVKLSVDAADLPLIAKLVRL